MVILQKEIQRFKHILKAWNKYVFGNFIMIWLKKHVLSSAHQALENSVPFKMDSLLYEEKQAMEDLDYALGKKCGATYWEKKFSNVLVL